MVQQFDIGNDAAGRNKRSAAFSAFCKKCSNCNICREKHYSWLELLSDVPCIAACSAVLAFGMELAIHNIIIVGMFALRD